MKKSLMILVSVALGASMASATDVESKNVVGFTVTSLTTNKYFPIGWQFAYAGGDTNILISSITNYANPKTGTGFSAADGLRKFNTTTSTWQDYYLGANGWRKSGGGTGVTTDYIMPGEMVMFVKRLNESALAQSGEVMVQDITIPVPTNLYVSMCNPYPIEIAVASVTNYLNPKRGIGFSSADGIRRFDSATSSWKDYYLGANGWRKSGAGTGVTTDIIAPGEGFLFVKRTTASSINFTSPL